MSLDFNKEKSSPKFHSGEKNYPEVGIDSCNISPAPQPFLEYDEIEGQELAVYAASKHMTTGEVWEKIKDGRLAGRAQNGLLYVYEDFPRKSGWLSEQSQDWINDQVNVQKREENLSKRPHKESPSTSIFSSQDSDEMTLLLDHLSLAKEENKEILKLTQESIARITQMTETIVNMKDQALLDKETTIEKLQRELQERGEVINSLNQEVEDLEMLSKTLTENND